MDEENVQITTIEELEYYLERWLAAYESGQPLVSDECYDHWKRQLEIHKPDSEFLKKIGNKPKRNKEKLPFILGSLTNKTLDNLDQWLDKYSSLAGCGYILSHKMDGVAILCRYTNGEFTGAWLRGDHIIGENITHKAKHFVLPKLKPENVLCQEIYLKGEILLNCDPAQIGYKNKRNAVAGILNRDDNLNLDKLYIIFHTWANPIEEAKDEITRLVLMKKLCGEERVVRYSIVNNRNQIIEIAQKLIDEITQYDKDGIVITINSSKVENVKIPEMKIAFKFNKQTAESTVERVEWNTSRTGKVVPLVYIKPVDLGGATITKCAGFNAKFIIENSIGFGAKIKIVRSGDVIPYIEQIITPATAPDTIETCPECGRILELDENAVNLICNNSSCPAQIQKKIAHFFEQLGLEQFSEKMISSLDCNSITDVFKLTKEDIIKIEGWGEKSADDFIRRRDELKKSSPEKLLAALGIENLGLETAKLLLQNFTFTEIIKNITPQVTKQFVEKLISIKGIGFKKAKSIVNGLIDSVALLQDLLSVGVEIEEKPKSGALAGQSFCITGALSKPRKEIEKFIEENGGINTSINNCDYLICNQRPSDSAKYKKALQRKIPIITEEELYQMI